MLFLTDPTPLLRAHAHNDYAHARPLEEALEQGFCSIEADVYLVDGELRVGHDRKDLKPGRTLERLYLDPLLARVKRKRTGVYDAPATVTLLVDIKEHGQEVYAALRRRLPRYALMLTSCRRTGTSFTMNPAPVIVVLSGDRPIKTVAEEKFRYAFIDGRLSDLKPGFSLALMPLVSESFHPTFAWNGAGSMPDAEEARLRSLVEKAHSAGTRLRFWGTPDTPDVWAKLYEAGVDLINTDDLKGLGEFLRRRAPAAGRPGATALYGLRG